MENTKNTKPMAFADMTVDTTALFCPNPQEFFARAYIDSGEIVNNVRTLPGNKYKLTIANINMDSTLRAEGSDVVTSNSTLSSQTISVTPLDFYKSICKKTLETSFVSQAMRPGSNGNWSNVTSFMSEFWKTLALKINEEIMEIAWVGDPNDVSFSGVNAHKALTTGWRKTITGTTGTVISAATVATTTNVVNLLGNVLQAAPARVSTKRKDLRYYVASNVANAYRIATNSVLTAGVGVTGELPLQFNGLKIVECPTMPNNNILLTLKDNLIYTFDGLNDANEIKAIDLSETTGAKQLLATGSLKIGFAITNPTEFVYYY